MNQMGGDCMTCMAMCGSGARIGRQTIYLVDASWILRGHQLARFVCFAVAVGLPRRRTAGRLAAASRTPGTTTSESALSWPQVSKNLERTCGTAGATLIV